MEMHGTGGINGTEARERPLDDVDHDSEPPTSMLTQMLGLASDVGYDMLTTVDLIFFNDRFLNTQRFPHFDTTEEAIRFYNSLPPTMMDMLGTLIRTATLWTFDHTIGANLPQDPRHGPLQVPPQDPTLGQNMLLILRAQLRGQWRY